jgi:hypothetical protein
MEIIIRSTLLNQKTYATFNGEGSSKSLSGLCLDFLTEQKQTWPDLREGCESLKRVKERTLPCKGFSVRLQFNPGRMKSSTAGMTEKKATNQPCFLCLDHLPEGQKGILYRSEFLVLCNPMPVFSSHFTLSHVDHLLQSMDEHVDIFLKLMENFGSGWMILYNGPKCGASAPDHLHFQAIPSGQMPIEKEFHEEKRLILMKQVEGVFLFRMQGLGRELILLEGDDSRAVEGALKNYLGVMKKLLPTEEEPMINIAGLYQEEKWRLLIFPRRKHRPEAFFRDGDARVLVSPGVIDMGGIIITPVEKDFERLNASAVEAIYQEVSLEGEIVERGIDQMGQLKGFKD